VQNTPGTTRRGFEKFCFQMINKPAFLSLLVFFSFCALFADDFRIAVCPKVHHNQSMYHPYIHVHTYILHMYMYTIAIV
jgi:hypothetical protein